MSHIKLAGAILREKHTIEELAPLLQEYAKIKAEEPKSNMFASALKGGATVGGIGGLSGFLMGSPSLATFGAMSGAGLGLILGAISSYLNNGNIEKAQQLISETDTLSPQTKLDLMRDISGSLQVIPSKYKMTARL